MISKLWATCEMNFQESEIQGRSTRVKFDFSNLTVMRFDMTQ